MGTTREKHPLKIWVARGPNGGVLWVKFWPRSVAVADSLDSPGHVRPALQPNGRVNWDGFKAGQPHRHGDAQYEQRLMSQVILVATWPRHGSQDSDREVPVRRLLDGLHFNIWQTYPEFASIPPLDQESRWSLTLTRMR